MTLRASRNRAVKEARKIQGTLTTAAAQGVAPAVAESKPEPVETVHV
jgi:hypothetical protein